MSAQSDMEQARINSRLGTLLLVGGLLGLAICLTAESRLLPLPLLQIWGRAPLFWAGMTFISAIVGVLLLWRSAHSQTAWRPDHVKSQFESTTLYTRKNCPLCDEARELIRLYRHWLPTVREIDVDIHPDFRDAFGNCVPVLEVDDEIRFRGRINEVLLRRLIQGGAEDVVTEIRLDDQQLPAD